MGLELREETQSQTETAPGIKISRAVLHRAMGASDLWGIVPREQSDWEKVAEKCLADPRAQWRLYATPPNITDLGHADAISLSPHLHPAPGWGDGFIGLAPKSTDIFRNRVFSDFENLKGLLSNISTSTADAEVETVLEGCPCVALLPDEAGKCSGSIVQHNQTDGEFLAGFVTAWNRHRPQWPLGLACATPAGTTRWHVRPCWPGASSHALPSGTWLPYAWGARSGPWPSAQSAWFRRTSNDWNATTWLSERDSPLPHRVVVGPNSSSLVGLERRDELTVDAGGAGEPISWSAISRAGVCLGPLIATSPEQVVAAGKVDAVTGATITIRLDGYPAEVSKVTCRLTTPSAGTGAFTGLHAPPYPESRCLVLLPLHPFAGWPVFLGNARMTDPTTVPQVSFPANVMIKAGEALTCQCVDARVVVQKGKIDLWSH